MSGSHGTAGKSFYGNYSSGIIYYICCIRIFKVWVVVNEGMKVDFVKIEESISVGKQNKQFVKKLKRNNLEDIQWVFGDYISM